MLSSLKSRFAELCKALVELVNTASRINELHLASKERMGFSRNLQLHQRIFTAIFPNNGVFGMCTRVAHPSLVTGEILENDLAVILRMDIVFHVRIFQF